MFAKPRSAPVGKPSLVASSSGRAKKARYARLLPSTRKSSASRAGASSSSSSSPLSVFGDMSASLRLVTGVKIRPFADEHLDGAAALLAERHARHREAEPLLPAEPDFRAEIEKERGDLGGAVALERGEVVGYLLGKRREDRAGSHVWSSVAGHAAREPELVRDLYAFAAAGGVDAGLRNHFVFAPALPDLIDPWFRLCFGGSAALAARATAQQQPVDAGVVIRESTREDARAAARLDIQMTESMIPSPSFSGFE